MPEWEALRRASVSTARGAQAVTRRAISGGRRAGQGAHRVRARFAGGETGMIRLFDLHALSAAGDTLLAVGLAGTIFFAVPLGEARTNVALYLLVTMVPFAILAPMVGPLLDRFRHGRRYALATTMLGRAFLAWMIADFLDNPALYPAAFGVLVLSRAYGVARAAVVPRLLPERLGLSQVNARGSVYGTLAGLLVLPLGLAAFWFGPQWPLRVASAIFLVGMVIALRLPAGADSGPEESGGTGPRPRLRDRVLTGPLVTATLVGSATHRALYGFLLIFLAFAIRAGHVPDRLAGLSLGEGTMLGLVSGALVMGTFLAVAAGSRLRIRRPVALQAAGLLVAAIVGVTATIWFTLPLVMLLCLVTAVSSGLAKVALDSSIQERVPEHLRATAFARSETLLMLAFVGGSAIALIPLPGQLGVGIVAGVVVAAAVRAVLVTGALRRDTLSGRPPYASPAPARSSGDRTTPGRPLATSPRPRPAPGRPGEVGAQPGPTPERPSDGGARSPHATSGRPGEVGARPAPERPGELGARPGRAPERPGELGARRPRRAPGRPRPDRETGK